MLALRSSDGSPSLMLADEKYPRAALGLALLKATRTDAEEQTAVSSLVLFDKEGKVLWRAP